MAENAFDPKSFLNNADNGAAKADLDLTFQDIRVAAHPFKIGAVIRTDNEIVRNGLNGYRVGINTEGEAVSARNYGMQVIQFRGEDAAGQSHTVNVIADSNHHIVYNIERYREDGVERQSNEAQGVLPDIILDANPQSDRQEDNHTVIDTENEACALVAMDETTANVAEKLYHLGVAQVSGSVSDEVQSQLDGALSYLANKAYQHDDCDLPAR